jgi:opacity protein-like surface antigen
MLKKTLLVGSILAVTSSLAIANPAPYVGGSIGIINNSINVKSNIGPNNIGRTMTIGSYRGVPFNVFAGYGGVISDNFYLAGELSGTAGTANISNNDTGLKTSYGLGASVIPGIKLSENSLLYARAGVVRTHFPSAENRNGGQLGLGLQTSLTQNIDIRTEYDFVAYKSIDVKNATGHKVASFAPRSDQFNVGLVYKFD